MQMKLENLKLKVAAAVVAGMAAAVAFAQGRDTFVHQQAYAEMQRVSGQVDVLQNNFDDLQRRVSAVEKGNNAQGLRQEIEALKASIAELRRQIQSQREEIVKDLAGRIKTIQAAQTPPAPQPQQKRVVVGPHREYEVKAGDTLSLIAEAFGTTVSKIKEMNGLKGDMLRIGQKIMVPQ